uniref:Uncharacterized protein n=1 Tax=Plectus sambesii TaxID=2011161 RepID=A0A914W735_9BILA
MMRYSRGGGKFYRGDAMDEYLNKLGLVRKVNAKDESSLFRAVAEQVYLTQQHHAEIKDVVLQAIESSRAGMEQLPGFSKIYHMLATLATVLRRDVVIYRELGKAPFNVLGSSRYTDKVVLCESFGGYYDSVNMRSMHEKLGIAQSIVYEMLYEGVFGVSKEQIAGAVKLIRNRPHSFSVEHRARTRSCATARLGSSSDPGSSELETSNEHGAAGESMDRPPFPFKVAKALDPAIYRNIEYDSWLEQRKGASIEMMLRNQAMTASSPFAPGMHCMLRDGPAIRHGIVQKILDDNGRTVFFADKGEMRDLAVSDLRPLPPELLRAQYSPGGDRRPQTDGRRMTDGSISQSVRRRQRMSTGRSTTTSLDMMQRNQSMTTTSSSYPPPSSFPPPSLFPPGMPAHPITAACHGSSSDPGSSELESGNEYGGMGESMMSMERPPWPFTVTRAPEPAIYHYTEYDGWFEQRRVSSIEMSREQQPIPASPPFPPGMRCMLCEQPNMRHAMDQKIMDDNSRTTVFFGDKNEIRDPNVSTAMMPPSTTMNPGAPGQLTIPFVVPTITVPYFDMYTYNYVNLDVNPSAYISGADLPYNDVTTLRFFFNLGVEYARSAALRNQMSAAPSTPGLPPTPSPPMTYSFQY